MANFKKSLKHVQINISTVHTTYVVVIFLKFITTDLRCKTKHENIYDFFKSLIQSAFNDKHISVKQPLTLALATSLHLLSMLSPRIISPRPRSSIPRTAFSPLRPSSLCAEGDNYVLVWAGRPCVRPGTSTRGTSRRGRAAPPLGGGRR